MEANAPLVTTRSPPPRLASSPPANEASPPRLSRSSGYNCDCGPNPLQRELLRDAVGACIDLAHDARSGAAGIIDPLTLLGTSLRWVPVDLGSSRVLGRFALDDEPV